MKKTVRTRFAPSPTGYLHVGGIRTALFAWLLARQHDGQFILRLEDTDKKREVEGSAEHLQQSLKQLGLDYDEGPDIGGPFAPYRQSERLATYKKWADKLIEKGRAYADPYTTEELQGFREEAKKAKKPFLFRNHRPKNPPQWDGSTPLRFKSDPRDHKWHDEVMGDLQTGPEVVDDFILIKSDGFPTYNFSHIVDDAEMEISHVIRSQEFIASVPNYLNLYEALDITPPVLATVPFIMNPQGNKKLSKRDGAKDVLDYIEEGYPPEALRSFIATLGWNDGTEQEVFTTEELIEKFSFEHVGKGGAHFDEQRLKWVSGMVIREMKLEELYKCVKDFWPTEADDFDDSYKQQVLALVHERLKHYDELPELTRFFFVELEPNLELIDSHKKLKKFSHAELGQMIEATSEKLKTSDFSVEDISEKLNELLTETDQKPVILFSAVRIVTTWSPASPGLAESLALLGKEKVLARLKTAYAILEK